MPFLDSLQGKGSFLLEWGRDGVELWIFHLSEIIQCKTSFEKMIVP